MQYYPKDKDPRLDERSARLRGRVLKQDLATLPYVPDTPYRDINVARATNYVTWDYGKKMWSEVDHLMMNFYVKAKTTDTSEYLEDKINRDVVMLLKDLKYEQAKVYCLIDMSYPVDKSKDEVTYYVTLHVQECNNTDLVIHDEEGRGAFFDLHGKNLETELLEETGELEKAVMRARSVL